jgi:hypothetical protein
MQKGNPFLVNFSTAGSESKTDNFFLHLIANHDDITDDWKMIESDVHPRIVKGITILGRSRFKNRGSDLAPEYHADFYIPVLYDPYLDKLACRFTHFDELLYIENLAKKNPTFVAKNPKSFDSAEYKEVTGVVRLEVGDLIVVGHSVFKVENHR